MYAEVMIAINTLFNFSMLSFTNKICMYRISFRRLLVSSLIGGTIVTVLGDATIVVLLSFVLMTAWAFGWRIMEWKRGASVTAIAALFAGGLLTALQPMLSAASSYYFVMIACIICYAGLHFFQAKWMDGKVNAMNVQLTHSSEVEMFGNKIPLTVFIDTGNTCTEPLSGKAVHFVAFEAVKHAMDEELIRSLLTWEAGDPTRLSQFPDRYRSIIRLIRLSTIQKKETWAIAFRYENWFLGNENGHYLMPGYFVLTKQNTKFPKGADAILHVSAMTTFKNERGKADVS